MLSSSGQIISLVGLEVHSVQPNTIQDLPQMRFLNSLSFASDFHHQSAHKGHRRFLQAPPSNWRVNGSISEDLFIFPRLAVQKTEKVADLVVFLNGTQIETT